MLHPRAMYLKWKTKCCHTITTTLPTMLVFAGAFANLHLQKMTRVHVLTPPPSLSFVAIYKSDIGCTHLECLR